MRAVIYGTIVGVCGNIVFLAISDSLSLFDNGYKWFAMAVILAASVVLAAYFFGIKGEKAQRAPAFRVGSGNKAGNDQRISITDIPTQSSGDIGSDNKAGRNQNIKIGR